MKIQRAIRCVFLVCLSALPAALTCGPLEAGAGDTIHLRGRAAAAPGARTAFRSPHIPLINRIAAEEGVDDYLVQCIVKVESDFNAGAVSVAGAAGLMQIMLDV
ncbi:MAG TPA: transglycosylase SLT domain-containing protein, partial [Spirochaetota bacterium]|nr:transglycosylase SLT domain-containing protein [Spirochaetota bacterium]